jgi:hypothetical protein
MERVERIVNCGYALGLNKPKGFQKDTKRTEQMTRLFYVVFFLRDCTSRNPNLGWLPCGTSVDQLRFSPQVS